MKHCICTALLFGILISGTRSGEAQTWLYGQDEHFEVLSRTSPLETRGIFREVYLFPGIIQTIFKDLPEIEPAPIFLVIVDSNHTLRAFLPETYRQVVISSFFEETQHLDLMVVHQDRKTMGQNYDRLFREYSRKLLRPFSMPPWFQVGIGEILGNFILQRSHVRLGFISAAQIQPLRQGGLIPIADLFAHYPDFTPAEHQEHPRYYAQCLLLAHYFLFAASDERRQAFLSYLLTAEALLGEEPDFERAVGMSFQQLEQILLQYIRRDRFNMHRYSLRDLPKAPRIQLRQIEPIRERSLVARAEIAAGQLDRAYLQLVHHLNQNEPVADLYRAAHFLYAERGEEEEARAMAEQALALGSQSSDLMRSIGKEEAGVFTELPLELLED